MADFYKVDSSASRKRPVGMRKSRRFGVNLRLPGLRNTFEVKAKVIWCHFYKTVFNKKYYRAGLQFTDPSPQVNVCIRTLEKTA